MNAAGMKFCGNCGKRLDATAAPVPADGGAARTLFMHAADVVAPREKLCKLVTIDQSGREGMTFTLKAGETLCGREQGVILFFDDPYVSPTHCRFAFHGGQLKVIDLNSLNGVYQRVQQERRLANGDLLRVGRQLYRYETLANAAFQVKKADGDTSRIWGSPIGGAFGRIVQILEDGRTGEIRLLAGERCQLGREVGDIVVPTDGFISGRHCAFAQPSGETILTDLVSRNGTNVRILGEAEVAHGDFLLVGNQMLRVEIV
jgi:pSer/pThr/pTyr-binding forkhead associated (FHA) protein